jgi:putative addiction module CopG family antidote
MMGGDHMRLTLSPATEQFIRQKVQSGQYLNPTHVVEAALATLQQYDDFPPGELERLIAEGEASGYIDGATALRKRRARRRAAARRSKR